MYQGCSAGWRITVDFGIASIFWKSEKVQQYSFIETNHIRLRAVIEGDGPLVILVHGFPESWHAWSQQIPVIAAAGFRVCAIDVRGYGGSDKPFSIESYSMENLVRDVLGVIKSLSPENPAILIGHDWGAPIVWNTALIFPESVSAVAGLSVPFLGVGDQPFIEVINVLFETHKNADFYYQIYFQREGVSEAIAQADVAGFIRRFYYWLSGDISDKELPTEINPNIDFLAQLFDPGEEGLPDWLKGEHYHNLVDEFTRSGFRGPINRYRNYHADFAFLDQFKTRKIHQPSLYIGGEKDIVLKLLGDVNPGDFMAGTVTGLRGCHILNNCGHWTQQEAPERVSTLLVQWLKDVSRVTQA